MEMLGLVSSNSDFIFFEFSEESSCMPLTGIRSLSVSKIQMRPIPARVAAAGTNLRICATGTVREYPQKYLKENCPAVILNRA